eukprot:4118452-Karenia_brevis.AAC.1
MPKGLLASATGLQTFFRDPSHQNSAIRERANFSALKEDQKHPSNEQGSDNGNESPEGKRDAVHARHGV